MLSFEQEAMARTGARAGLLATVIVAAYAVSALGASSASAACFGVLKGEGSSLQKIAQQEVWGPGFEETECETEAENPEINYTSVGTAVGLAAWRFNGLGRLNTEYGYIASDDAPNAEQITRARRTANEASVVVVPVAEAAMAIVVHPPASCTVTKITNARLEEAFSGKLTDWSTIGTGTGCAGTLRRVVLREVSETTLQFKSYLSQINPGAPCAASPTKWGELERFEPEERPNLTWPECGTMAPEIITDDRNLAGTVANMEGTIGYTALPDAKAAGATVINLQDGSVKGIPTYASPEGAEETSNCSGTVYTLPEGAETHGLNIDWAGTLGGRPTIGGSNYPICMLTFDLAWHSYTTAGFTQYHVGTFVKRYLDYILRHGRLTGKGGWFSALPSEGGHDIQLAAEKAAEEIE